jgi:hypothetical protein
MDEEDIDQEVDDDELQVEPSSEQLQRRKDCRELCRLFCEVNWAIQCLKIAEQIEGTCSELREGFFAFAYRSLWDDALACLMRVLDEHKDAFSLWKIEKLKDLCEASHVDVERMREFSKRLKRARDKSHFHIDVKYAADADQLWSEVDIKESEMFEVANDVAKILSCLLCDQYQFPANLSRYDAADIHPILECLDQHGLGNFSKR